MTPKEMDDRWLEGAIFIPHTQGSKLKKELTEMERVLQNRGKIKYVEYLGVSAVNAVGRKDPWSSHCGRQDCLPCKSKPGRCGKMGVIYTITCMKCKLEGKEIKYIGESGRTGYDRGIEHGSMMRKMDPESPMVEHGSTEHEGEELQFEMEIKEVHPMPFQRQSREGFPRSKNLPWENILINSKDFTQKARGG